MTVFARYAGSPMGKKKDERRYEEAGAGDGGDGGGDGGAGERELAQVAHEHEGDELDAELEEVDGDHGAGKQQLFPEFGAER
jgi:hypothetical protein